MTYFQFHKGMDESTGIVPGQELKGEWRPANGGTSVFLFLMTGTGGAQAASGCGGMCLAAADTQRGQKRLSSASVQMDKGSPAELAPLKTVLGELYLSAAPLRQSSESPICPSLCQGLLSNAALSVPQLDTFRRSQVQPRAAPVLSPLRSSVQLYRFRHPSAGPLLPPTACRQPSYLFLFRAAP